jgi:hypothetical protein
MASASCCGGKPLAPGGDCGLVRGERLLAGVECRLAGLANLFEGGLAARQVGKLRRERGEFGLSSSCSICCSWTGRI